MIAVWIFLKTSNKIIHQSLRRNFHPPPGSIPIREVVPPLIIGFLGDLALLQCMGRGLPFIQHPVKLSRLLILAEIDPQADVTLRFLHIETVTVFHGEKRVHEAYIGVNIRNRNGMRRNAENLRHLCRQVSLRVPILGFILRHAHIGGIGREAQQLPQITLRHLHTLAEIMNALTSCHEKDPFQQDMNSIAELFRRINMNTEKYAIETIQSPFLTVTEAAQMLHVSKSHAYKIVHRLNREMKQMGYLTIAGRISRAYLMERMEKKLGREEETHGSLQG